MAISTQSFATMVQNQIASIQTAASTLINFTSGSILRAYVQANAGVSVWLESLALQVAALSRYSTSYGADADTWGLDWGYYRAQGGVSSGQVTFYRYTPTNAATVPVGLIVMTADGTQTFTVVADTTNAAWNGSNGFTIAPGISSVTVTCQSVNYASATNVAANSITLIQGSVSGVDYCNNTSPFTGGAGAQTDAAYKTGFPPYLLTLARGTVGAITGAVTGIQTGAQCNVIENYTYVGAPQAGFLTVIVDDGTGSPGTTFMTAAQTAVNNMRSGGIQVGVYAPTIITANVTFTISTSSGYVHASLVTLAQNAVTGYINSLLDGQQLSWSYIADVIYASSPGIYDVTNVLLNGGTADLVPASVIYVIKAGTVTGT